MGHARARRPFHVSALLVKPHSQTDTGGGSSIRSRSYTSKSSSTLPDGTSDVVGSRAAITPRYGMASITACEHRPPSREAPFSLKPRMVMHVRGCGLRSVRVRLHPSRVTVERRAQ